MKQVNQSKARIKRKTWTNLRVTSPEQSYRNFLGVFILTLYKFHLFLVFLLLIFERLNVGRILGVYRSSCPEVFLGKGVLEICNKFTGEHPCLSGILIKLQSNSIECDFNIDIYIL